MKNRIWIALLLAATLAIPVLAQQSSQTPDQNPPAAPQQQSQPATGQSNPSQPAATDQQNQQAQPGQQPAAQQTGQTSSDQNAAAHQPLKQETHEGFWGKLNPFARKKYVQRQMTPVRDRVNELDELTANNSKAIKDVDSRAQEGIRMASSKADQADQHAVQAGQTAQQANQTAQDASTRLTSVQQVVSNIDQYKPTTETEIRFRPGQAVLSKKAKDALDEMATPLANQKGYIVEVQGFSPGRGQASVQDSQNLANSVVRYLVLQHNVPVYRIYVLGMGNAPSMKQTSGSEGSAQAGRNVRGRRVEVALLKNDLEQLQQSNTSGSGSNSGATGGVSGTTTQPSQQPSQPPATSQPAQPQTPPPSGQQQTPPPKH